LRRDRQSGAHDARGRGAKTTALFLRVVFDREEHETLRRPDTPPPRLNSRGGRPIRRCAQHTSGGVARRESAHLACSPSGAAPRRRPSQAALEGPTDIQTRPRVRPKRTETEESTRRVDGATHVDRLARERTRVDCGGELRALTRVAARLFLCLARQPHARGRRASRSRVSTRRDARRPARARGSQTGERRRLKERTWRRRESRPTTMQARGPGVRSRHRLRGRLRRQSRSRMTRPPKLLTPPARVKNCGRQRLACALSHAPAPPPNPPPFSRPRSLALPTPTQGIRSRSFLPATLTRTFFRDGDPRLCATSPAIRVCGKKKIGPRLTERRCAGRLCR